MSREDHITFEGVVTETGRDIFRVCLDGDPEVKNTTLSGGIRKKKIRVVVGDRVRVSFSPYDLNRGQIIYRYDSKKGL